MDPAGLGAGDMPRAADGVGGPDHPSAPTPHTSSRPPNYRVHVRLVRRDPVACISYICGHSMTIKPREVII